MPSWIVKVTHDTNKGYFLSKGMKCVFMVSCIVIRESNKLNAIMPVKNTTGKFGSAMLLKGVNYSTISFCGGFAISHDGFTFREIYPNGSPYLRKAGG